MQVVEIDGAQFSTLEEFFAHFAERAGTAGWGTNLDAFNDVLRGGFGTPDAGFILRWKNHALSRERLGYLEAARQLERRLESCHPSNRQQVADALAEVREQKGATVFEWLLEIIREHGPGGNEADDGVLLELA
ncbi:barstar family protein [Candidatus Binatia bacterium]|nr:barstar family protein [Candidatus Binatia bacterium]